MTSVLAYWWVVQVAVHPPLVDLVRSAVAVCVSVQGVKLFVQVVGLSVQVVKLFGWLVVQGQVLAEVEQSQQPFVE